MLSSGAWGERGRKTGWGGRGRGYEGIKRDREEEREAERKGLGGVDGGVRGKGEKERKAFERRGEGVTWPENREIENRESRANISVLAKSMDAHQQRLEADFGCCFVLPLDACVKGFGLSGGSS